MLLELNQGKYKRKKFQCPSRHVCDVQRPAESGYNWLGVTMAQYNLWKLCVVLQVYRLSVMYLPK